MAACGRVYDSRHLQADCQEPGWISSGTNPIRSVIGRRRVKICGMDRHGERGAYGTDWRVKSEP